MHKSIVTVKIDEETFFWAPEDADCGEALFRLSQEGLRVDDPDILCSYLAGTVEAGSVLAAGSDSWAERYVQEASASNQGESPKNNHWWLFWKKQS